MTKVLLSVSAVLFALAPQRAEACSPEPPHVSYTVPASGETYAANGPIQIVGSGLDLSALTATIDGAAAQVEAVSGLGVQGVRLTPAPQPGQAVHLAGDVCQGGFEGSGCQLDLSFTAGPDDTTAPGAIDSLTFDVFDYPDVNGGGGSCTPSSDLQLLVRVASQAVAAATPELWRLEGLDAATGKTLLFSGVHERTGPSQVITVSLFKDALGGAPLPSGVCLELTGIDLAGNEGTPVRQCLPCRYRNSDDGSTQPTYPEAPVWSDADIVSGGSCDPDGAGGSGQAGGGQAGGGQAGSGQAGSGGSGPGVDGSSSSDEGGCAATPRGRPGLAGALGLALGLAALGRRRRG